MSDEPSEEEEVPEGARHDEDPREDVEEDEERRGDARDSKNPDNHRGDEPWD